MKMSASQLAACLQIPLERATAWVDPLNTAMVEFGIDSPARQAMFLPQIGHESARLTQLVENLNYRADRIRLIGNAAPAGSRWRALVPRADALAGSPERFGNAVYGGRLGNGAAATGDGYLFRGRGLIQITGRTNYTALMMALGIDCVEHPELIAQPAGACRSAGWFWQTNDLRRWADTGDFDGVCDLINFGRKTVAVGDANGYAGRLALYECARKVLL